MYRQIIVPKSNNYLLNLPANFVGRMVEITAEAIKQNKKRKYSLEENKKFYSKYRFGTLQIKFSREELYDR